MNKKIINEKLLYLKESIIKLEIRLKRYKIELNEEDLETLFAAMCKFAEEIVEIAIKINNKFLEKNKDFASSYHETFTKLSKHYKIDKKLLEKIAKTTGFRNRISHEYEYIDKEITIKSFENMIELYKKYIKLIMKF